MNNSSDKALSHKSSFHTAIGEQVADFTIKIAQGKKISLADYRGKFVVVYFYPKDDTPGCTIEAQEFNRLLPEFNKLNAEIIGISRDNLDSHNRFTQKCNLKFPLGSDEDGEICKIFGVLKEQSLSGVILSSISPAFDINKMGINRNTFLIGPDGKVEYIWTKVSVKEHAREVLEKIRQCQSK